jgi:hypothetical protein
MERSRTRAERLAKTEAPKTWGPEALYGGDVVHAFHAAALDAGAPNVEEPGVRPEYSQEYYAARTLDPDGNAIEVVHRAAAKSQPLAA